MIEYLNSDLLDILALDNPLLAIYLYLLKEPYKGNVPDSLSLHHVHWKKSLWHVLRQLFMHYVYRNLFQDLRPSYEKFVVIILQ